MNKFESVIFECDQDIRLGRADNVAKRLAQLNISKIPRTYRHPLAKICRRAGLLGLGLKILTNVLLPSRQGTAAPATAEEIAEYAVLLTRSGAVEESLDWLEKVDTTKVPDAFLYRAFAHFSQCEFGEAIPHLIQYLNSAPTPYWRLVGQVNLAYAYVATRQSALANEMLMNNLELAQKENQPLIKANTLDLLTQLQLQTGEYDKARETLSLGVQLVGPSRTSAEFMFRKWQAVLDGMTTKNLEAIEKIRAEAVLRSDFENQRHIDQLALQIEFDEERHNYLVFGTPFVSIRERIAAELGRRPSLQSYVYGVRGSQCFDVLTAQLDGKEILAPGGKIHQLVEILLRDFYRPLKHAELFTRLFPGEHFDVFSSANRVHQILFRAREWIDENDLPLELVEAQGSYSLRRTNDFSFLVPLHRRSVDGYEPLMENLKQLYTPDEIIKSKDAREKLGISRQTFSRFATWAVERGHLIADGEFNARTYQLRPGPAQFSRPAKGKRAA